MKYTIILMKNQYIKIQKIQYFQNLFVGVTFKKQRRSYRDGSILFLTGVTKKDILFLWITNETNIGANLSEGWIVKMNDKWLEFAMRIQSIAQAGLQYGKDRYDIERYEQLRTIAAEMVSERTDLPLERVNELFCNETGYQTPKIDTRAAVFSDGKILLVHENNGTWSLPGGWCDVDMSVASNVEKEVREESGLTVMSERLIAVQDWRRHNVTNYIWGVIKFFVLCRYESGNFEENIETTEIGFFGRDELPEELATEKNTKQQILMCFDFLKNPDAPTLFD